MPRLLAACLAFTILVACSPSPRTLEPTTVENSELDVRLAQVPEGFVVTSNEGRRLELVPAADAPSETGTADAPRVVFDVGPEETGVNLVAAIHEHQARIEGAPGADYQGAQELQGPLGTAFYSRGRFLSGDLTVEETCVFTIHPRASRQLSICYRYPAGDDSRGRVQSLLGILGEVE